MEIIYCETCGQRITDTAQAKQAGNKWFCLKCLPETADVDPVRATRHARGTSRAGRGTAGATGRRALAAGQTARGGRAAEPKKRSPMPFVLLGAGGLVFILGVVAVMSSGGKDAKKNRTASASRKKRSPATQTAATPAASKTRVSAHPKNPFVKKKPVSSKPSPPAPQPRPAPAAPYRVPAGGGTTARAKLQPLKKAFKRQMAAGDLRGIRKVVSDLGMITRDYPGTPAGDEAMALIKKAGEYRARRTYKKLEQQFNERKGGEKIDEKLLDLMARISQFARDRKETQAGQKAGETIKTFREQRARTWWERIKPGLSQPGQARQDGYDRIGMLLRTLGRTAAANEASKALRTFEVEERKKNGSSAWLYFQGQVRRARDARYLRSAISFLRAYMDSGAGAGEARFQNLLNGAYVALDQTLTSKARVRTQFLLKAARIGSRFRMLSGTEGKREKSGEHDVWRLSAPQGRKHIRLLCPLDSDDNNLKLTLFFKALGIKNLTYRIYSGTHKEMFEHTVDSVENGSWSTQTLVFAKVRKGKKSLHNARLRFLIFQAEQDDPSSEKAALLLQKVELTSGRK